MKHIKLGELGGNILAHTNSMDITMAWKKSCKDVATRVGSFALHIIFLLGQLQAAAHQPHRPTRIIFKKFKRKNFTGPTTIHILNFYQTM